MAPLGSAARVLLLSLAVPAVATAVPQTPEQQRCLTVLHRNGTRIVAAQGREDIGCVRDGAQGLIADPALCLSADASGKVGKARAEAAADAVGACGLPPDFGVGPALEQTIEVAAITHTRGLVADLFGDDLAAGIIPAADDRAGARCQAAVMRRAQKVAVAHAGEFAACVARQLAHGAQSGADLGVCAGQDANGGTARAAARFASTTARRCSGIDAARAFPGYCAGASDIANCLRARLACRACRMAATAGGLAVDCDLLDDGAMNASCRFPVSLSGNAFNFDGSPAARIAGAEVWVLEHPERRVTTDADGFFRFDGLEEGSEATLVLDHPDFHAIQTGTITLGSAGAERVSFQAVTFDVYNALAALLAIVPDEANRCQMVTTVTRVGRSIYDVGAHGEAGVVVSLDPPLPPEQGPIYFNASVLPERSLVETSEDGGVLFIQGVPGEYVWTATKAGSLFTRVKMKCRAGLLVNASPPWGLQTH